MIWVMVRSIRPKSRTETFDLALLLSSSFVGMAFLGKLAYVLFSRSLRVVSLDSKYEPALGCSGLHQR